MRTSKSFTVIGGLIMDDLKTLGQKIQLLDIKIKNIEDNKTKTDIVSYQKLLSERKRLIGRVKRLSC